jgi:hypothetical protein
LVPEGRQGAGCRKLAVASNNGTAVVQILAVGQEQGPKMIAVLAHRLAVEEDAVEHRLAAAADRLAVVAHRVAAEAHDVVEIGIAHQVELYTTPQQATSFVKDGEEHQQLDVLS